MLQSPRCRFLKVAEVFGHVHAGANVVSHLNGVNLHNLAQLYQSADPEYSVNKNLRLFYEPQSSRDYLPTDPYAQHLIAYFFGATQRLGKSAYVQFVLNSGGPTESQPIRHQVLPVLFAAVQREHRGGLLVASRPRNSSCNSASVHPPFSRFKDRRHNEKIYRVIRPRSRRVARGVRQWRRW